MENKIPVGFTAEQLEFLNSRYVLKDSCIERHEEDSQRITNILVTLTKVSSQISIMIKILSVIGGTVLTAIVGAGATAISGVIFK